MTEKSYENMSIKVIIFLIFSLFSTTVFASKITIAIQPFNKFSSVDQKYYINGVKKIFGDVNVDFLPIIRLPERAYYKPRNRYRAEKLIDHLESIRDTKYLKVVGLTVRDISTTKDEYYDWGIFGLGTISGPCCVVSTFRLKRDTKNNRTKFLDRVVKVINHELGHTFGLYHCPNKGCNMEDAGGTIKTVDYTDGQFCSDCKRKWLNVQKLLN